MRVRRNPVCQYPGSHTADDQTLIRRWALGNARDRDINRAIDRLLVYNKGIMKTHIQSSYQSPRVHDGRVLDRNHMTKKTSTSEGPDDTMGLVVHQASCAGEIVNGVEL